MFVKFARNANYLIKANKVKRSYLYGNLLTKLEAWRTVNCCKSRNSPKISDGSVSNVC
jgi:hypothetical protein